MNQRLGSIYIMNKIILALLIFSQTSLAQEAVFLNKGDKAEFSGYLLTEDKVKSLRNDSLEKDADKQVIDSLNKSLTLQQNNVDILLKQNSNLVQTVNSEESLNNWEKVLYFGGGIVLSGLAIYGAHSLYR